MAYLDLIDTSKDRLFTYSQTPRLIVFKGAQFMDKHQIRVLIADDQAIIRSGLRNLLTDSDHIDVIAEATDGAEAVRLASLHQPDVILNAANEIAVELFLHDKIGFMEMSDLVEHCLSAVPFQNNPDLQDLEATDRETRRVARERIPTTWNS